jgi:hypothetical protein
MSTVELAIADRIESLLPSARRHSSLDYFNWATPPGLDD